MVIFQMNDCSFNCIIITVWFIIAESELHLFTSNHILQGNYGWILIATNVVSTDTVITFSIDGLMCEVPLDYTHAAQVLNDSSIVTASNGSVWEKFRSANLTSTMPTFIVSHLFLEANITRVEATVETGNVSRSSSGQVNVTTSLKQNCLDQIIMINAGKTQTRRTTYLQSRKILFLMHLVDLPEGCENMMVSS